MSDELTKAVMNIVSNEALWSSPELYTPIRDVELMDVAIDASAADRIIALVRADERKRIRDALLSDEAITAAVAAQLSFIYGFPTHDIVGYEDMMERQARETAVRILNPAITAIGLTEEGGET